MKTLSSDTHPSIELLHIELIRKVSISRRLDIVSSLAGTTRQLSWNGICVRYNNEPIDRLKERFGVLLYGDKVITQRVGHLISFSDNTGKPVQERDTLKVKQPEIIEITLRVIAIFEKLGIRYSIGGSLASSAFGIPRATMDIDIVADIKQENIPLLQECLAWEFYADMDMIREAVRRKSSFNIIHLESLYKVDIFILQEHPFDLQALARRVQKKVSEDNPQEPFFTTPEDIILNKLKWYKDGGGVFDRQWYDILGNDILGVLKVQGKDLDMPYLSEWAEKLNLSALLTRAIAEAGVF
ncbi:MAG: hypothetical protein HZA18_07805 [Nitrospirae bacterium]|nr:hypothetical protein [Nitrospirota bacterium]